MNEQSGKDEWWKKAMRVFFTTSRKTAYITLHFWFGWWQKIPIKSAGQPRWAKYYIQWTIRKKHCPSTKHGRTVIFKNDRLFTIQDENEDEFSFVRNVLVTASVCGGQTRRLVLNFSTYCEVKEVYVLQTFSWGGTLVRRHWCGGYLIHRSR